MTQSNKAETASALREDQSTLMSEKGFSFSGYERDPLFLNLDGRKVLDISGVSGVDALSDGRAAVFADFDNDGDADIFMNTIQGEAHVLFRNNVGHEGGWLRVSLAGDKACGPAAWGAQVRVKTAAGIQSRVKSCGEGFLSQNDPRLLFGLAGGTADWIEVSWPGGTVQRFEGPFASGSEVLLRKGASAPAAAATKRAPLRDAPSAADIALRKLKQRTGDIFPALKLRDARQQTVESATLLKPGRRLLVNLWATWCTNCAAEMPELDKLRAPLAAAGIDLVGISLDTQEPVDLAGFAQAKGIGYPLMLGGADAAAQLYAGPQVSVPLTLLLDEHGKVLDAWNGWSPAVHAALTALAR